jgi:hypothetical protein
MTRSSLSEANAETAWEFVRNLPLNSQTVGNPEAFRESEPFRSR